jgi:SAM-dependent methyltransferase
MATSDKAFWNQKYSEAPEKWLEPDPFLAEAYDGYLAGRQPGRALDLAGGAGRHAIWLANRGWDLKLIDVSEVALQFAREKSFKTAAHHTGKLTCELVDLRSVRDFGKDQFDLVMVFFYLERALFPAILEAIKPGGFLIYKTYTTDQLQFKKGPSDPAFLLQPNELPKLVAPLRVLLYREQVKEKAAAELVARKTAGC